MLTLTKSWWVLFLRGVLTILFAVVTFARPDITLGAMVVLFGTFALADGGLHLTAGVRSGSENWGALLLAGIFGIGAGIMTIFYPGLTVLGLLYFIAFWSIVTGVSEIIAAIRLRNEIEGESLLAFAGLLSVIFGIYLVAAPGAGALGLLMVIAFYAFVAGIVLILLGLKLRALGNRGLRHATA